MLIREVANGKYEVRRRSGEVPFALLVAPRRMPRGTWGIRYRNPDAPNPLGWPGFNVFPHTRADAERELQSAVNICSDYQLGLRSTP